MKRILVKRSLNALIFLVFSLVIEGFLFLQLGFGVFPEYFMLETGVLLLLSFVVFFIPWQWLSNIFTALLLVFLILISYTNIIIFKNLEVVFYWAQFAKISETKDVASIIVPVFPIIFFAIILVLSAVSMFFVSRIKIKKNESKRTLLRLLVSIICIIGITISTILPTIEILLFDRDLDEDLYVLGVKYQYETFENPTLCLKSFGIFTYYFGTLMKDSNKTIEETFLSQEVAEPDQAYNAKTDSVLWNLCKGNNLIMICAESFEWFAISPELTPTLYALANGFDLTDVGVRQFYDFSTDEDGFVSLERRDYSLSDDSSKYIKNSVNIFENLNADVFGLKLNSYISKSFTDGAEAASIGDLLNYNLFGLNNYCNVLPNVLIDSGAVEITNYLHSYATDYYARSMRMPIYGFQNILFGDEISTIVDWERRLTNSVLDSKVLDYTINFDGRKLDFLPSDKTFFSMMMTVSTHGGYGGYSGKFANNYKFLSSIDTSADDGWTPASGIGPQSFLKTGDSNVDTNVINYLARSLDTEHMMAILIYSLMQKEILDKTTIVFFADHNSHSELSYSYKKFYYENFSDSSPAVHNVPAFIYSTSIEREKLVESGYTGGGNVSKLSSVYDLTPTILTLLGIDFNTNYYIGYPVLCRKGETEVGLFVYESYDSYYTEKISSLNGIKVNFMLPGTTSLDISEMRRNVINFKNRKNYVHYLYFYNAFEKNTS